MKYLEAASELRKLIRKVNQLQLQKESTVLAHRNCMFLFMEDNALVELDMKEYSNEFVKSSLERYPQVKAFVMTDLASMQVKDQAITYWLYKGYHRDMDKGMVYFQPIDEQGLQKKGSLQYSNLESNIFLPFTAPDVEESSANAMETDEQIAGGKSIVFLIGNMNEDRLLYDIQRLMLESASNVQNHKSISFKFIMNVSKFGGAASAEFRQKLTAIENYAFKVMAVEFPNVRFEFDLES